MLILSVSDSVQDKEIHNVKSFHKTLEELVGLPSFSFKSGKEMRRACG